MYYQYFPNFYKRTVHFKESIKYFICNHETINYFNRFFKYMHRKICTIFPIKK